jgi:hypothetical protein
VDQRADDRVKHCEGPFSCLCEQQNHAFKAQRLAAAQKPSMKSELAHRQNSGLRRLLRHSFRFSSDLDFIAIQYEP